MVAAYGLREMALFDRLPAQRGTDTAEDRALRADVTIELLRIRGVRERLEELER